MPDGDVSDLICDVAMIATGTTSPAQERGARRDDASMLLIDESFTGTTCVAVGCLSSKHLVADGEAAHAVR